MSMLEVKNIYKNFGDLHVLKGVSTTVEKGEVISIIGVSGSGKSTLLRCMNLLEKPTFGETKLPSVVMEFMGTDEIEIELCGLCTDICVVSNALILKAAFPEAEISVDSRCCAGVTPQKHEAALETMRSCQINVK